MARPRDCLSGEMTPSASKPTDQGSRPQGVAESGSRAVRRSKRISRLSRSSEESPNEVKRSSVSAEENRLPHQSPKDRKRTREVEHAANQALTEQPMKEVRPSLYSPFRTQVLDREAGSSLSASQIVHISHWAHQGQSWPEEYFQDDMLRIIHEKGSAASLRRKPSEQSIATSTTPSDQKPRGEKSTAYKSPAYADLLQNQGGLYMHKSKQGITDASKTLCRNLLETEYVTPEHTIFSDNAFDTACQKLQDKNEARVLQDISRLLVPSAETLATLGDNHFAILVESVNEGWNNCIPATNPRPQPDYAVGFGKSAFSDDQLSKLGRSVGDHTCLSRFMATHYMQFPFLTCEVKCGAAGLDIADRQNGHSMAVAVRGIVELFRRGKKESDLHGKLLTFSISHDHRTVRLYGYYPIIDGAKIDIYRHPIHEFALAALDGKERWTAYNFTVGVYTYSLSLIQEICSVIDSLPPDFSLEYSQESEPQTSAHSGLSQQFENQVLVQTQGGESGHGDLGPITPNTSMHSNAKKRKTTES